VGASPPGPKIPIFGPDKLLMYFGPLFCCILAVFGMGQHVLSPLPEQPSQNRVRKFWGRGTFWFLPSSAPLFWSYHKSHQYILQSWGTQEKKFLLGGSPPFWGRCGVPNVPTLPPIFSKSCRQIWNNSACCKSGIIAIE